MTDTIYDRIALEASVRSLDATGAYERGSYATARTQLAIAVALMECAIAIAEAQERDDAMTTEMREALKAAHRIRKVLDKRMKG